MKIKKLLYLTALCSVLTYAQKSEQRVEIQKTNKSSELQKLKTQFQSQYEQDERNVVAYLEKHPTVMRTEIKNGSVYHIKSIDKNGNPVYINTKSNVASGELIKSNSLYSGGSIGVDITGTGMVVGIWDGGQVRATHELLVGKATMQANQALQTKKGDDHMTHVTGTIVGKDIANSAKGIAYNATSKNYDWDNDLTEMTSFAADGYLISNHSYGMGNETTQAPWTFGAYDEVAKNWDALLKTTPNYLPFVAIGNEQKSNGSGKTGVDQGYDVVTGSAASKNVITVGGVNADRSMSDYSNFGPTDDGRVKPDICARGTGINSSITDSDTAYSGTEDSSGTSYAAPAAAASGLLLQQYYYSLNNSYMSASMLKCLMLHSADDAGPVGPDLKFGWGILNIERAAQIIKDSKTTGRSRMHTFTTNPTNNSSTELSISGIGTTATNVGVGTGEIKASICWTDDEGPEQLESNGVDPSLSRLVYNFDIKLRRLSPFVQTAPYKSFTMATRSSVAALAGDNWFQNNVDNYKQTYIAAGGTEGGMYALYLRKSATSPAAVRNVSVVITGLATKTLGIDDFKDNDTVVFYSALDNKIKLIDNDLRGFGSYEIYNVSGAIVAKGNTNLNEILFENGSKGVYVLKFTIDGKSRSVKFIK